MDSMKDLKPLPIEKTVKLKKYFGFTSRQLLFLLTYGLYNVFRGALVLIAGPFYPPEAEKRDINVSTIGFVFSAYDFATFLSSLFYGKFFIPRFGPHHVVVFSAFNTAISAALFGCLGFIENRTIFLIFSFALRLIAGAGDAGFYPSAFTIFAYEFPELVATTIGLFELFFGIGAVLGPIICGQLVDTIGFAWTYISVAGCLLLCSILILIETPFPKCEKANTTEDSPHETKGFLPLLKIPAIYYAILSLFSTAVTIGFITGTLESHLQQFDLSSLQTGAIFSVSTVIYTVASPLWGQVSDKLGVSKVLIIASGSLIIAIGFALLGPLDIIHKGPLLWVTLVGLAVHGIGIGPAIMIFFSYASESVIAKGFSDSTATYGIISSIFTLTFSLGNSFGSAVSGVLYDAIGFNDATLTVIGLLSLVILFAGLMLISTSMQKNRTSEMQQTI